MQESNLFNHHQPSLKVLFSKRLCLRPLVAEDFEAILKYASDPEAVKWLSIDVQDRYQVGIWLTKKILSYNQLSSSLTWAICLKQTGECIGCIELFSDGTIGYASSKIYWGNGYMTEAVKTLLPFAFMELHFIDCLKITVYGPNIGSQRVAQNCGFTQSSLIQNYIEKNGLSLDAYIFTLTKEEYLLQ
jgi:[ribosomal protein S5]-alanine N-acetyltransferase